jgi:argininosuccinate lyase
VETLTQTPRIYADMIAGIKVKPEAMRNAALQGYATATDLADYLVKKGLPFRDAHEVVALAVRYAEQRSCDLGEIELADLQKFSADIAEDVYQVLSLEGSLASRNHIGGTAPQQVAEAIARARAGLAK